jgi:hypothetical protein
MSLFPLSVSKGKKWNDYQFRVKGEQKENFLCLGKSVIQRGYVGRKGESEFKQAMIVI